uniref:Ring finger protein 212B n=1 Tax=Saimiri boliviensis boliviensis TaxID=39432 RepID=A0A2K6SHC3_SAIBB
VQEAQQTLVSQDNRSSSAESIPFREAGFGSFGQKPLHQLQPTAYVIGDFFFQTIPKWAFRPHKSPYPQQFCSEGEQNHTREFSY